MFSIIKSWIKVFKGVTTDEDKRRAKVCNSCESAVYNKYLDFLNDELKEVEGMVCSDCDCPLLAKIRSDKKCYKW